MTLCWGRSSFYYIIRIPAPDPALLENGCLQTHTDITHWAKAPFFGRSVGRGRRAAPRRTCFIYTSLPPHQFAGDLAQLLPTAATLLYMIIVCTWCWGYETEFIISPKKLMIFINLLPIHYSNEKKNITPNNFNIFPHSFGYMMVCMWIR